MRRRPVPKAERYKQLLQVARDLIRESGIAALTMSELAERSGAAKPVVYSHFPNREAVAIALLDEHFKSAFHYVQTHIGNPDTLEEYVSRLIDAAFDFEATSDLLIRKITNGFSASDEVNQAFLKYQASFRDGYRELLEQQSVPSEIAEIGAHGLSGLLDNSVYEYANRANAAVAKKALKAMVMGAIAALAPQAGRKPSLPEAVRPAREPAPAKPKPSPRRKADVS